MSADNVPEIAHSGWIRATREELQGEIARLESELAALRDAQDKELARWQHDIYNLLCATVGEPYHRIDGGGCDSGDPLDFTMAEIGQALAILRDEQEALREANTRQAAPVSDEEFYRHSRTDDDGQFEFLNRNDVDVLLAARAQVTE